MPLSDTVPRLLINRLSFPVLVLACAFAATIVFNSSARAQADPADDVVRVSTDLLLFPIRVKDKRVDASAALTGRDLLLKDKDGVTSGLYFARGADRVAFVFALDQSGSLRDIITQQRDAALALYQRFGTQSSIAVLRFAETATIAAAFDRDATKARDAFNFAASANQHTAIFDAAVKAIDMFSSLPRIRSERRIVILISDGLDNASRSKAATAIDLARKERVSFYVIHLPLFVPRDGRLGVRAPAKGFRDLAEKTGGRYSLVDTSPFNSQAVNLSSVFQAIEDDLKSQYLLGFYLNERANDGRRHTFSLTLPRGAEYQFGELDYSQSHEFFVNRPREFLQRSR